MHRSNNITKNQVISLISKFCHMCGIILAVESKYVLIVSNGRKKRYFLLKLDQLYPNSRWLILLSSVYDKNGQSITSNILHAVKL